MTDLPAWPGSPSGGSEPLTASLGIGFGDGLNGPDVPFSLLPGYDPFDGADGASHCMATDGFPHTIAAGEHIGEPGLFLPPFSVGTLRLEYAEFGVSNADGTEKLVVHSAYNTSPLPFDLTPDSAPGLGKQAGAWTIIQQVGSDLSVVTASGFYQGSIASAAGGEFFAYCFVDLSSTGLAV